MSPTRQQILDRFGGDEEKMSAYYRELQKKSRENYKGTGGLAYLKLNDPEKLKEITSKGGKAGKRVKDAKR